MALVYLEMPFARAVPAAPSSCRFCRSETLQPRRSPWSPSTISGDVAHRIATACFAGQEADLLCGTRIESSDLMSLDLSMASLFIESSSATEDAVGKALRARSASRRMLRERRDLFEKVTHFVDSHGGVDDTTVASLLLPTLPEGHLYNPRHVYDQGDTRPPIEMDDWSIKGSENHNALCRMR
jgi:hypothetical protein